MNCCSKLLCYVYEIPNAFIVQILQAEPKKLASVVKPNMRCALGIAVDFVGEKATEYQHIGQTFIWWSGTSDPFSNNPSYSFRVCAKCALKIWNVIELACFLKANLNPVVADVEATSDDCKTQQRWQLM